MATIVGSRTPLFYKSVPGGPAVILDGSKYTGNIFYVDSAVGTDSAGYGSTPGSPLATIDYAIGLCTANQGDVILVLPGHAETINTAGAIEADKAGISIFGLGNGDDRPTVTVGSSLDTSTVLISAVDVLLKNLVFVPGNDGVDVLLAIAADGTIIEDCEFRSNETDAYQADTYIQVAGGANVSDRCTIRRCKVSSITAGATQAILVTLAQDTLVIEDCWIDGDFSAAAVYSTAAFTNALIRRNAVSNRAAGIHAVEFTAAATGLFIDNRMYGDTLGTILDPGSLKCLGNLETDAIDQAGVDSPRTSAGGFPNDSITAAAIATNAIDDDAIATGAIAATAFAAGAIDAAAIAAGAIDAATFAADALQSMQDEAQDAIQGENLDHLAAVTTVAADMTAEVVDGSIVSRIISKTSDTSTYVPTTDSLEMLSDKLGGFSGDGGAAKDDSTKASLDLAHTDLDAIIVDAAAILLDTGTDGVVIGPDAITAAKIADNALSEEHIDADAAARVRFGIRATKAASDKLDSVQNAMFTIAGGRVMLLSLSGEVSGAAVDAGANATKWISNPTVGTDMDLCATLDIASDQLGTLYGITGIVTDAMTGGSGGGAMSMSTPIILAEGTIDIKSAADGGTGGALLSGECWYMPLDSGATIVAA